MSYIISVLGTLGAITSIGGFIPQIIKIQKTKSVSDLSLITIINFFICSIVWIIYGFLTDSRSLVLTNIGNFLSTSILLLQKSIYQKKESGS